MGLPWWLSSKESTCKAGDTGSIPGSGRSPGEGNGNPFQYSYLENGMVRRAWWAAAHGVAKIWTRSKQLSMHAFHIRITCRGIKILQIATSHYWPGIAGGGAPAGELWKASQVIMKGSSGQEPHCSGSQEIILQRPFPAYKSPFPQTRTVPSSDCLLFSLWWDHSTCTFSREISLITPTQLRAHFPLFFKAISYWCHKSYGFTVDSASS